MPTRPTDWTKTNPNATDWTKQSVNAADFTKQTINPTFWEGENPFTATGALLLSGGGFLLLSDDNYLGIYQI